MDFVDYHVKFLKKALEDGTIEKDSPLVKEYVDKLGCYIYYALTRPEKQDEIQTKIHEAFVKGLGFDL